MKNKYIRLIVIAYISLNILGVIFYCTIPKGNFVQNKSNIDLNQLVNMKNQIMNNPHILSVKSSQDKYNIKNYNFNYTGKELEITLAKKHHLVFIDRKASDDNKIEVYCYPAPIIFNGLVFTDILKEPNIKLIGNELNIEYKKQNYSFTQFSK
ncbi:MAG: hypothetical protein MUO60_19400, partial [Clostridiaceae bacterium]|nr:hypothetical protein [Clostridiaceae bacterium]